MAICKNKKCSIGECDQTEGCAAYVPVVSNADRIRAMSDEELACLLAHETYRIAKPVLDLAKIEIKEEEIYCLRLEWLKQPAEVEEE